MMHDTPSLAVWKFASCDGCQLSLLDCEDELPTVADRVRIAHFPEATSAVVEGPYDISLVEGSVSTVADTRRIIEIRECSRRLVAIGTCATAGGIQALRNGRDVAELASIVYPRPEDLDVLTDSTPIADHVTVDLEIPGCPIDRRQLLGVLAALLAGHVPRVPTTSVCTECKAAGTACVLVAHGSPCLGPITRAGCGALCPSVRRGCFGCFGPMESPNVSALRDRMRSNGADDVEVDRLLHSFANAAFDAVAVEQAERSA